MPSSKRKAVPHSVGLALAALGFWLVLRGTEGAGRCRRDTRMAPGALSPAMAQRSGYKSVEGAQSGRSKCD